MTPYGHVDLGQHWFRYWLVAWRHQAITWTNVDLSSVRSCGIHVRTISQEIPQPSITKISLKITSLEFISNLLGANELKYNRIIFLEIEFQNPSVFGPGHWGAAVLSPDFIVKDPEGLDSDRWIPLRGGARISTPRVRDSPIWIQPRGVFRINPTPGS